MIVDHAAAKVALDALEWKIPSQPKVTVVLSEPDENGLAELTIEGSFHATEETVAAALGLRQTHGVIERYTPSTVGHVVSEPGRPPSPDAARASVQPKGRIVAPKPVRKIKAKSEIVEANVGDKPRRPSQRRK